MKRRFISFFVLVTFLFNLSLPYSARAQIIAGLELPTPSQLVMPAGNSSLPVLKGLKLNPQNPLQIDFIIDTKGKGTVSKDEAQKLIKYFLAALAVPKEDIWVNLSPYEQNRIVPQTLGVTDLGKDLLGEDYILKQLASSLTYPESATGKQYWNVINGVGANNHSPATNNFNKVWIIPDKSSVYENNDTALISESRMAVKTEEDYLACRHAYRQAGQAGLAMQKNGVGARLPRPGQGNPSPTDAFKQNILPLIEKEVNEGANFANLRQIYNSLVLATWFKQKFFNSFYRHYINQAKLSGITLDDKTAKEKIYNLYIEAFHKGVYNYVKSERITPVKISKRSYFSGGFTGAGMTVPLGPVTTNGDTVVEARLTPEGLGTASGDQASLDGQGIVKRICDFRNQVSKGYDRDLSGRLQFLQRFTPDQMERLPLAAADILGALGDLATIDGIEHDMHMDPRPQYRAFMIKRFCRAAVAMAILHYLPEDKRAELLANNALRPHFETAVRYFIKAFPRVHGVDAALADAFLNNGGYAIMETFGVWDRVRHGAFGSSNNGDVSREHHAMLHKLAGENLNICLYGSGHVVSMPNFGTVPAPHANGLLGRTTFVDPVGEQKFIDEVMAPLVQKLGTGSKAKIGDGPAVEIRDVLLAANIFWVKLPVGSSIDDAHAGWSQFAIHLFCADFNAKPLGQKFQDLVHEAVELACKQDLKGWTEADAIRAHRLAENYVQSLEWLAYGEFYGTGPGQLNDDRLVEMSVAELKSFTGRKAKIVADRLRYILLNYAHQESYYLGDALKHHTVWGKILEKFSSLQDFLDLGIDVKKFNPYADKADKNGITKGEWVSLWAALSRAGYGKVLEELIAPHGHIYFYFGQMLESNIEKRAHYAPDNLKAALIIAKMEAQRWKKMLSPESSTVRHEQLGMIRQEIRYILGDLAAIDANDSTHMNPEHMSYIHERYMRARIVAMFCSALGLELEQIVRQDQSLGRALDNSRIYCVNAERFMPDDLMRVSIAAPAPRSSGGNPSSGGGSFSIESETAAVGGENFTGMETKVSGNLMPMELKGTDFSQLSGLGVEVISIRPID